jgi:hypothetical protein
VLVSVFDSVLHSQTDLVNSYQTLSEQRTPTAIEALAAAGLVKFAITSYKLGRLGDGVNDGEITFGFVLVLHYTHRNIDFIIIIIIIIFLADLIPPNSSPIPWLLFPTSTLRGSGNVSWVLSS